MRCTIGVLALQGAFREHVNILQQLDVTAVEVRLPKHFNEIDGLIIPGGESTTMAVVASKYSIAEELKKWVESGKPIFGTCAGMILLAREVIGKKLPDQVTLQGMDIEVHRNFFGSQLGSFMGKISMDAGVMNGSAECEGMFIRAPVVSKVLSKDVKVLAKLSKDDVPSVSKEGTDFTQVIVGVEQKSFLAISFHPELQGDNRWHVYFLKKVGEYMLERTMK